MNNEQDINAASTHKGLFQLRINGSGRINNVSFDVTGAGQGNTQTGQFKFKVHFSDVARGIDPFANVLGVLILPTGAFGREVGDAISLMTLAGGEFDFSQIITGEGIEVLSAGRISRLGDREFEWKSNAEGQVSLKSISAIEPFSVVTLPQGLGKITEVIALPLIDDGHKKIAYAVRTFTFTPRTELRHLQLRNVTVTPQVDGLTVSVDTVSNIQIFPGRPPTARLATI